MSDLYRYIMLSLHGGVVWLHGVELAHVSAVTITVAIGAAFMGISLVEFIHLYLSKRRKDEDDKKSNQYQLDQLSPIGDEKGMDGHT